MSSPAAEDDRVQRAPSRPGGRARRVTNEQVRDLRLLERSGDYDALIVTLRERLAADPRVVTSAWVKGWLGRRWRDLFLSAAAEDEAAVHAASSRILPDRRPARQRVAERFLARDLEDWRLELPPYQEPRARRTKLLYCPSFVYTAIPLHAFEPEMARLRPELGVQVLRATSHGFRGCEANVSDLLAAVELGQGVDAQGYPLQRRNPPREVVLLGYSKGVPDALTLLARHPEIAPKVRSVVSWAGAVEGSPSVDALYRAVQPLRLDLGPAAPVLGRVLETLLPVARYDGLLERREEWDLRAALRDLTTDERARFMRRHRRTLDDLDIPFFNIVGSVGPREVPYFQVPGARSLARQVGENDMQVGVEHAQVRIPMATTLAVCRANHWDLAMGPFPRTHSFGSQTLRNRFPRGAALLATLQLHRELGLVR